MVHGTRGVNGGLLCIGGAGERRRLALSLGSIERGEVALSPLGIGVCGAGC